ncbi:MAG: hypothetical protein V7641_3989 [Blastocatellia bacterium]
MKKTILAVLAVGIVLIGSGEYFLNNRRVQAVSIQINIKDLPEHGLTLIAPTDTSFEGKLSAMLGNKPNPLAEGLRSYSVLIENRGKKTIVGYRLKWEMIKADGTVSVRQAGGVNVGDLIGKAQPELENPSRSSGFAVKSGSTAFVSPAGSLSEGDSGTITGYATGSADSAVLDQVRQNAKDKRFPSLVDHVMADIKDYKSFTVSLDGVFYEDGTFVGPDTTGFFASVETCVNAKRDLLEEIAFAVQHNRSMDEIFNYVEELASTALPVGKLNQGNLYNIYKRMDAEEMLRMRTAMSSQKAVEMSLRQYRQAWPTLKKL